jgi:transposase
MNAHSKDLRQRILNHALTHSIRETARIFHVSPNMVYRLKKLFCETGGISLLALPGPSHAARYRPRGNYT